MGQCRDEISVFETNSFNSAASSDQLTYAPPSDDEALSSGQTKIFRRARSRKKSLEL
jgi:hypothetical protein